jgi:endonuclease/exonuclease/phosphatase family metal-dependent hydrolase
LYDRPFETIIKRLIHYIKMFLWPDPNSQKKKRANSTPSLFSHVPLFTRVFKILPAIGIISLLLTACTAFHPDAIQPETIFGTGSHPLLKPGQTIRILSWNVQYMAGKNYIYFYDLPDGNGPDKRPSAADIAATLKAVARVIRAESPDIILLQEVDDNARRTDYQNQLTLLLELIPADYKFHTSAFYWKSAFVPHPKIMGRVGMKLSTISKYHIAASIRHQLPLRSVSALRQRFELKRAVLETRLPMEGGRDFIVMNTHLSTFAQGEDTMQRQVEQLKQLMDQVGQTGSAWVLGGDFNLLPPGDAYLRLPDHQRWYYREKTELELLTSAYPSIPSLKEANGNAPEKWYTHFPNDPRVTGPDRTIDYMFYAQNLKLGKHRVIQEGTLHISDHLPLVAEFIIPSSF